MPNLTGGMAQYTLACFGPFLSIVITVGGYLTCQTIMGSSEAAMFGNTLSSVFAEYSDFAIHVFDFADYPAGMSELVRSRYVCKDSKTLLPMP